MKTIKTLLTSLFLFVGLAAQAQVIVIEKTDGTKDEYQLYEVDSVAYVPKIYKYFLGETEKLSFYESDLDKTTTSKITSVRTFHPVGEQHGTVFIYPESWGDPVSIIDVGSGRECKGAWRKNPEGLTLNMEGYICLYISIDATSGMNIFTWPESVNYYVGTTEPTAKNLEINGTKTIFWEKTRN